jgi:hypothetical protein
MKYFPGELADRLNAEGEAVLQFFQELSIEQWDLEVYMEGQTWRVREVLAHFIAAELGFQKLIQSIAAGGPGASQGFKVDQYNQQSVDELRRLERDILLGQFAMVRERTVAMVREMQPAQMDLRGNHPTLGESSLEDMIRLIHHHNNLHLRDVRRALRAAGPGRELRPGMV